MKYTHEQWNTILEEHKASGRSCAAFCRERGIDEKRFLYHWRKQLKGGVRTYTPMKAATDMRLGIDRLAEKIKLELNRTALGGGYFVFLSRCRGR